MKFTSFLNLFIHGVIQVNGTHITGTSKRDRKSFRSNSRHCGARLGPIRHYPAKFSHLADHGCAQPVATTKIIVRLVQSDCYHRRCLSIMRPSRPQNPTNASASLMFIQNLQNGSIRKHFTAVSASALWVLSLISIY